MLCESAISTKAKVKRYVTLLNNYFQEETRDQETQTLDGELKLDEENEKIDKVLESIKELEFSLKLFIMEGICDEMSAEEQLTTNMSFYNKMNLQQQTEFFGLLGNEFNSSLFNISEQTSVRNMNMQDLCEMKKLDYYNQFDPRLLKFIETACMKTFLRREHKSNLDYKINVLENMVKARNFNYVSKIGARQAMVTYMKSDKSKTVLQIFNKTGAKGSRPILEEVIKNTENSSNYEVPKDVTVFYSFDNIQTLMKCHRLESNNFDKTIATVVTSVLLTQPDGENKSKIQYQPEHSPAYWYSKLEKHPTKNIFIEKFDDDVLKQLCGSDGDSEEIVKTFFKNDLEVELDFILKDTNPETGKDTVDMKVKESCRKRIKLCLDNHINHITHKNRKLCDRPFCKKLLKDTPENASPDVDQVKEVDDDPMSNEELRTIYYMNVPVIESEFEATEHSVGAFQINPNNEERIKEVLNRILEHCGLRNNFSVKLVINNGNVVEKLMNDDPDIRRLIVVTVDGLPYKTLISILQNSYICAVCGYKIDHLSEITNHLKSSQHNEYFQTYGAILPNIGLFHECQTMMRAFVHLTWNIDLEALAKSIGLDSPKALFSFSKGVDFRKTFDLLRQARSAKLRELLNPYVQECLDRNVQPNVAGFLSWTENTSLSENYKLILNIERVFGTSLILFLSSMRANNSQTLEASKKQFSSLFHVMNNRNYAVMDVQCEYLEKLMKQCAPQLSEYMATRKCNNLSKRPYSFEPLDERHEEFNKAGLNLQTIREAKHFLQSFSILDHFNNLKKACEEDLGLSENNDKCRKPPNYEEQILLMRTKMRSEDYLNKPTVPKNLVNLDGHPLNERLTEIVSIARKFRDNNVMKAIRHNSFSNFENLNLNVLQGGDQDYEVDYEEQIQILLASETNIERKALLYEYWHENRNENDFDKGQFVKDILDNKI